MAASKTAKTAKTAKTMPTGQNVEAYLNGVEDEGRRKDALALLALMKKVTKGEPKLWAGGMVGFGSYHYRYPSGHEGDCFLMGFALRKQALTLYLQLGFEGHEDLLEKLGPYKVGKSCLYVKRLDDVHLPTLTALLKRAAAQGLPASATSGSLRA